MGPFDFIDRWQKLPKQKKDVIRAEWPLFAVVNRGMKEPST